MVFTKKALRDEHNLAFAAFIALNLIPVSLIFTRVMADVLGSGIAALFLYRSFLNKDWQWLKQWPVAIGLAWWAYSIVLVTPFALEPWLSLQRAGWGRYVIFFAAMAYWLSSYGGYLKRTVQWQIVLLCVVMADAAYQYMSGHSVTGNTTSPDRLSGPFAKPVVGMFLAKMSFPVLGLWSYYAMRERSKRYWLEVGGFMICVFTIILLSNERAATLTFSLGLGLAMATSLTITSLRKFVLCVGSILILLIAVVYTTQPEIIDHAHRSSTQFAGFRDSPYGQLWLASFAIWKQYPFLGAGMMNFRIACLNVPGIHYCDLHSHNTYLEALSETGIFGLAALLAMILGIVGTIIKACQWGKPEQRLLMAFCLAALMPVFFPLVAVQSFFSNWPAWVSWWSISWAVALARSIRHG